MSKMEVRLIQLTETYFGLETLIFILVLSDPLEHLKPGKCECGNAKLLDYTINLFKKP
ncbi:MAG: hypothetical protein REI64_16375 [Pedobacter sp.]|uniref:hypothetical protein n=1 Tax=Pedobacter sp. TaxID=1411316 RepID=UPI002808BABB|nr:hypothetical protein [Pedobacter sp.]MDQ8006380.1 hypothetical protein [Pedobacter sp.]